MGGSRETCDPRHTLSLCASLVQNPMNLGALCRTAEVFRLQALVLPTLKVIQDWEFRKLAVSAYLWQPLVACAADQLPVWIAQRQSEGVTVLALDCHRSGTPLPEVRFPRQTALLLGRELTGIPAELVQRCDGVVEIPQFGRVESLNVHTAAAIAAYAYLCQHGDRGLRTNLGQ